MIDTAESYFGRLDLSEVRQILYGTVQRSYSNNIHGLIKQPLWYYVYYKTQGTMLQIFLNTLEEVYNGDYGLDDDGDPVPYIQAFNDLNRRAIMPASALAWITVDGWRWHHEEKHKNTDPDLNYGLVLKYPEPTARAAAYAANLHRPALEATLRPEELAAIERQALERARRLDSTFDVESAKPDDIHRYGDTR